MSDTSKSARCPQCGAPVPANAAHGLCPRCVFAKAVHATAGPPIEPPDIEAVRAAFPQLEVLALVGAGGMGAVFKVRQPQLDRFVALKILAPERTDDARFAGRFQREAQALARLSHPHIVTVHDFGVVEAASSETAGGNSGGSCAGEPPLEGGGGAPAAEPQRFYYLLMEFVDGVNLRQAMKAGRFTPEQALAVVPPVCEALQFAHEHGIVHRDIKPENLLLDKAGRVKIADFGIAKMLGEESATGLAESQPAGTPQYMAPEQKELRPTDHRADIYSLGVVLYELLTGELPSEKIQPPSRKVQIDVRLDEIVLRALEHEPELRYATAADLKTAVETVGVRRQSAEATPVSSGSEQPAAHDDAKAASLPGHSKPAGHHRFVPAILITLAMICLGIVISTGTGRVPPDNRRVAVTFFLVGCGVCIWMWRRAFIPPDAQRRPAPLGNFLAQPERTRKIFRAFIFALALMGTAEFTPLPHYRVLGDGATRTWAVGLKKSPWLEEIHRQLPNGRSQLEVRAHFDRFPPVAFFIVGFGTLATWIGLGLLLRAEFGPGLVRLRTEPDERGSSRIRWGAALLAWIGSAACILHVWMLAIALIAALGGAPHLRVPLAMSVVLSTFLIGLALRREGKAPMDRTEPSASAGLITAALGVVNFFAGLVPGVALLAAVGVGEGANLFLVAVLLIVAPLVALRLHRAGSDRHKAFAWVAFLLAVPIGGFALFFLNAMRTETGGWNPAMDEAVLVPLTWLGALLLPVAGAVLWRAGAKKRDGSPATRWVKALLSAVLGIVLVLLALVFASQRSPQPDRPESATVEVTKDQAVIKKRRYDGEGLLLLFGAGADRWTPGTVYLDAMFDVTLGSGWFGHGVKWVVKTRRGIPWEYHLDAPGGPTRGRVVFHSGTPAPEADGSYLIGEFRPVSGEPWPIAVKLQPDKP